MDFGTLSRRQLQALCKQFKIPANTTNIAMAAALRELADGGCAISIVDVMSTPSKPTACAFATTPGRVTRSQLKKQQQADDSSRLEVQGQRLFAENKSARQPPVRKMKAEGDTAGHGVDCPEDVKAAFHQQGGPGKTHGAQDCDHVVKKYPDTEMKQIGMNGDDVDNVETGGVMEKESVQNLVKKDDLWKEEKVAEENNQDEAPFELKNCTEKEVENVQNLVEDKKSGVALIEADKKVQQIGSERSGVPEEAENVQKLIERNYGNIPTLVATFDHEPAVSEIDVQIGTKAEVTEEAEHVQNFIEIEKIVMEDDVQNLGEENDREMWCENQLVNVAPERTMAHDPTEVEQLSSALSSVSLLEVSASPNNFKEMAKCDKENLPIGLERFSLRQLKKFQKELYQKKGMDKMVRPKMLEVMPLSPQVRNN